MPQVAVAAAVAAMAEAVGAGTVVDADAIIS